MTRGPHGIRPGCRPSAHPLATAVLALAVAAGAAGLVPSADDTPVAGSPVATSAPASTSPAAPPKVPPAAAAPRGLPVIDYWTAPRGFPDDPTPLSTAPVTEGLLPTASLTLYDAPGGKPRARLKPSISGLPVTLPIIDRGTGWVAVLLPSVNRKIGWIPAGSWIIRPLRDHLVVHRRTHRLTWLHDGVPKAGWLVATGTTATPTPLGRTFVLGRTTPGGAVYAGVDALALGSVPDDRHAVSPALRRAHTGIHGWYRDDAFGRSVSNGCVRMPRSAQRTLLKHISPGTAVTVVD